MIKQIQDAIQNKYKIPAYMYDWEQLLSFINLYKDPSICSDLQPHTYTIATERFFRGMVEIKKMISRTFGSNLYTILRDAEMEGTPVYEYTKMQITNLYIYSRDPSSDNLYYIQKAVCYLKFLGLFTKDMENTLHDIFGDELCWDVTKCSNIEATEVIWFGSL